MSDAREHRQPAGEGALPRRALAQVADAGSTGSLQIGGSPGGTLWLVDGRVVHAESPAAPGVGELLTGSGRLSRPTWQAALAAGRDDHRVGALLIEQGHLSAGELELCVLGAIYDAAFFALRQIRAPVRFDPQGRHWLGPVTRVDVGVLSRESTRRRRLLDGILSDPVIDTAPLAVATRTRAARIVLSALQWEIVVRADGRLTPTDLARLLGRSGFAVLEEVRRLAASGLLHPVVDPQAGAPVDESLAPPAGPVAEWLAPPAGPVDESLAPPARPVAVDPEPADPPGAGAPSTGTDPEPDVTVLARVHSALKALL